MLSGIFTFLGTAATSVFSFLGGLITGGIGLIWTETPTPGLTDFGELVLIASAVGVGFFALKWVLSLIPFAGNKKSM